MRQTYILVFDFPEESPEWKVRETGMAIEDIMNEQFPDTYQDVEWREGE